MSADPHNSVAQTITLSPVLPAEPLVVCNSSFLHTLAVVEREIAGLKITDEQSAQAAANIQQRLTSAGNVLEATRANVKAPFVAKCKEIDAAARAPALRIEQAKTAVKRLLTTFADEQEQAAAKAEEARRAELRRLEAQHQEEQRLARIRADELAKQAAELAAKSRAPVMDLEFDEPAPADLAPPKTETEKQIDAVRYAPVAAPVRPVGVAFKVRLLIDKIDLDKLPETFVIRTANEAGIRTTFCTGWKEGEPLPVCPGVTFKMDKQPVSTGRASF